MSDVKPIDVHDLKEGSYIVMDGEPCVIKDLKQSAPGKHGHAKFRIVGVGIFDGKKRVDVKSTHSRVEAPVIHKKNAQVLNISGDKVQVMDNESYETFEIEMPEDEELKKNITTGSTIIYWDVMGVKEIKASR